jgi:hypothetical protein
MPWFEIEFDYSGNAPTKSKTKNFCAEDLGYGEEDVEAVGPIKAKIKGATKKSIVDYINGKLPMTRSKTIYESAS